MTPKHTPAPWIVNSKDYDRFGETVWVEAESNGHYVCELVRDAGHTEFANARLIAASPELLEAAEALLSKLDHITTDQFSNGGEWEEREALRAIVAKAKGEQL